ncbi:MAG: DUF3109 family protein [Muribaculaceae bacterium]|nr:DUF3109 family protein [Muribaculaceae bacterium]
MLQIQDTLVSLDLAEEFFCCDLSVCRGQCCIEGDAGAPVTEQECERIREVLPAAREYMLPRAIEEVEREGVSYVDEEGDLVTTLLDGRNCAFTCYGPDGVCLCALEAAQRAGRTSWRKPASCALYPVRLTEYPSFIAVNYHKWDICRSARANGRRLGIRLFQFLKEPLTERFGSEWYDELVLACTEYLKSQGEKI